MDNPDTKVQLMRLSEVEARRKLKTKYETARLGWANEAYATIEQRLA